MSKLARMPVSGPTSVITSISSSSSGPTHQGGPGYDRDAKSELFLLATTNFVGEDTFYEDAKGRDTRYVELIRQVTVEDPTWVAKLLRWLRSEGNMRSASIVGAIEYGRALATRSPRSSSYEDVAAAPPTAREVLASVLQRPDEPGEALGYWLALYGRPLPKWLKRGLGDGALKLYHEHSALKYDGQGQSVRFADVLEFSQIDGRHDKEDLFKWVLDRRHGHDDLSKFEGLPLLQARAQADSIDIGLRRGYLVQHRNYLIEDAGFTWESLSGWLQGPMDKVAWESVIPSMGYMALLRNLRNFDEAGVSDEVANTVIAKLIDPEQVAKSRQLPMRFLSAYNAAPSDRWKHALGKALDLSLASVPKLDGPSLVLIDTSGSMNSPFSKDGSLMRWDSATMFGLALAKANPDTTTVVSFSDSSRKFVLTPGRSVLGELDRFRQTHFLNSGTDTARAVSENLWDNHRRVIILTDEQAARSFSGSVDSQVGDRTLYTFNLAGYHRGHAPSGSRNRHTFGGLTDSGFKAIATLESRQSGRWPWESASK